MSLTVASLAEHLGVEYQGDGGLEISAVASLQRAEPGSLSFLANSRYRKHLSGSRASAVIVTPEDARICQTPALLLSNNVYACFARAAALLGPAPVSRTGRHPSAVVDPTARIAESAWIGPLAVIEAGARIGDAVQIGPGCVVGEDSEIGAGSILTARVTVMHRVWIGQRVTLHPGAVVGSDGFGLANENGTWIKVPQSGSVRIGDDVDIGANTTIDRGTIDDTRIEEGVKIDNQVQVGHNVTIGAHTAIAGCVGISGSAHIGAYCTLAGGVGLVGHIQLADHVHITGMSLVTRSISQAGSYSAGTPLMPLRDWRKNAVRLKTLDELNRKIRRLEKKIDDSE